MPDHEGALRALWCDPPLVRARRHLAALDEATARTQIAISEIPAPTGEEGARAAWIAGRFRALGLTGVRLDDAGNVIGRRGAAGPPGVVICAHLDTVFPRGTRVAVTRSGALLTGPGIGDNARGLAALLALAEVIDGEALETRHPVDFVATTGEEGNGDLRGAKQLFAIDRHQTVAVIALDGAGDERVVHGALGARRYRVVLRGPGGHSWSAFGAPNAVHAAANAATKLSHLPLPLQPRTTLSVGRMAGGTSVNTIPAEAWLEIDVRSSAPAPVAQMDAELRAAIGAAVDEENARVTHEAPRLSAEIIVIGDRPSGETPAGDPLVRLALEATRLVGRKPELATASTDANVPISLGIPAIAIGAGGRGGDAHTPSEWFDNTDGLLGLARALAVVTGVASRRDD